MPDSLKATILSIIRESEGVTAKNIRQKVVSENPDIRKKQINKFLYSCDQVKREDTDGAPIWHLVG